MIAVKDINRYELHFRQFMLMANTVTLTNIVYYVYIDLYIQIYIPNQAIRMLSYAFIFFFLQKIPHECGSHVTLTLTLSFNF